MNNNFTKFEGKLISIKKELKLLFYSGEQPLCCSNIYKRLFFNKTINPKEEELLEKVREFMFDIEQTLTFLDKLPAKNIAERISDIEQKFKQIKILTHEIDWYSEGCI